MAPNLDWSPRQKQYCDRTTQQRNFTTVTALRQQLPE
jgi:hypothetical protein